MTKTMSKSTEIAMPICVARKGFIFVWIPKTAGTSIANVLSKSCLMTSPESCADIRSFDGSGGLTTKHRSVSKLIRLGILDSDVYETCFKFSFVRNPWDRFVSLFHYWQRVPSTRRMCPKSFADACKMISSMHFGRIGVVDIGRFRIGQPQSNWLFDDSRLLVDFVGRYNTLNEDFSHVCRVIGVVPSSLPRLNQTSRGDYRSFYNDETANIIGKVYADDIRNFGFSFDDGARRET